MSGVLVRASAAKGCLGRQVTKVSGCVVAQHRDASDATPAKFKLGAMKRGGGGRSSFSGIVATVFGTSGYLGTAMVNKLGKIGSQVILPYRCDPYDMRERRLAGDLGQILFMPFDLKDDDSIRKCLQYSNVVINLIGKDYETKFWSYQDIHMDGPARIARLAKEAGVEKFIHMSHLNAKPDMQQIFMESKHLRSKYLGELMVRDEFPEATIIKSADMFGDPFDNERFLRYYSERWRWSHLGGWNIPLWKKGMNTIKQPVLFSDVAQGITNIVTGSGFEGKDIQCVGSQRYYLNDIVDYCNRILRRDDVMHISDRAFIQMLKCRLADIMPREHYGRWMNPDKMEREYHTDYIDPSMPTLEDLGVELSPFDKMAYFYLHPFRRASYYGEAFEDANPEYPKQVEYYEQKSGDVRLA